MGLTGLEIYKHLPKTNCKDCGAPTCLAFAMSLASGKASLDALSPCYRGRQSGFGVCFCAADQVGQDWDRGLRT